MTKEQKILTLLILLVAGGGAVLYFTTAKPSTENATNTTQNSQTGTAQTASQSDTPSVNVSTEPVTTLPANSPTNTAPTNITMPYESSQTYKVPENSQETIKVTLYIKSGVIEDIRFVYNPPTKHESAEYLSAFNKAIYKQGLIGKKVSDVSLSRVGGASLTTNAFMQAVEEINGKIKA